MAMGAASAGAGRTLQRKCDACEREEQRPLQRAAGGDAGHARIPPVVDAVLRDAGAPLARETRAYFEPRLGRSLDRVRVHTGHRAAESARAVGARAYTVGEDVVLREGSPSPRSAADRRLLGHELAHTVQQSSPDFRQQEAISHPSDAAEQEADRVGESMARFGPAPPAAISQRSGAAIQRDGEDGGVSTDPGDAGAPGLESAQRDCVKLLGGCPETRSGGVPEPQQIAQYNEQCRQKTGYSGPAVQPECRQAPEPEPTPRVCKAVMGGREVDHWVGTVLGQEHTYVNFVDTNFDTFLIEGGPLDSDPHVTGAWVKPDKYEKRGNRVTTTYPAEQCPAIKKALFDTTATYHAKRLPYDPSSGPNSNSFAEQLTYKTGVPADFNFVWDHRYDYWRKHTRPF